MNHPVIRDDHAKLCAKTRELIDSKMAHGPWQDEADIFEFEESGLACLCLRNSELFNWCGYVGVPVGHPWHGKGASVVEEVEIHGGLTFAGGLGPKELWWFGFDCGHAYDLVPAIQAHLGSRLQSMFARQVYRDLPWVIRETKELARQAAKAGGNHG